MTDAEINDILLDFEKVRDFVTFKLVGRKTNEEKLKGIPHRDMGDMAIVYQVNMEKMGIPGSALINNGMMETYGKSAEDLEALAEENTPRIHPAHISSMEEVLGLPPDKTGNSLKMLVVTNDIAINGAAVALYPGTREKLEEMLGKNFVILPSSVHEVLAIPRTADFDLQAACSMVKDINVSEVSPQEQLSDQVYILSGRELVVLKDAPGAEHAAEKTSDYKMAEKPEKKPSVLKKLDAKKKEVKEKTAAAPTVAQERKKDQAL